LYPSSALSDLPRLLLCSFDVLPGPSGSSRRVTEYLKALPDRFSVVVLSVKTPDHSHIEKYQGARLLRVPVGAGDLASRIQSFERAVRRQLESEEYALVHFTDPFGGYALCELKDDYGYRLIYEAQTFPSQELRYTHPQLEGDRKFLSMVRSQELFCLMNADLVLTGSSTTRAFIHSLGVGQESVRVVREPMDLGRQLLGIYDGLLDPRRGPVVMGSPLCEPPAPPPVTPSRSGPDVMPPPLERPGTARPPALPPRREERASSQPVEPPVLSSTEAPPRLRTAVPPSLPTRSSMSLPALPPLPGRPSGSRPLPPPLQKLVDAPASPPSLARSPSPAPADEPEEISEAEAEEIQEVDAAPTPAQVPLLEEPEEISSEEIEEAESPNLPAREPPESKMNPWFAQLAHGYCPPEGTRFARHTPPTTFPGRDEEPIPGPAPRAQAASRSKPS
jgi:Glycosyltransferase Family 4